MILFLLRFRVSISNMTSSVGQPLVIKIPVSNDRVQRAFDMLKNRCVHRNEDQFQIYMKIVNHNEIDERIRWLLVQYNDSDIEFKRYIERIKFNNEGQQFAKAIVVGTKSRFSVSVIATNRIRTGTIDQHTILIATASRTVETRPPELNLRDIFNPLYFIAGFFFPWIMLAPLFGVFMDSSLEKFLKELNEEENKKCFEAMAFYVLGNKIQQSLGSHVDIQFIEQ